MLNRRFCVYCHRNRPLHFSRKDPFMTTSTDLKLVHDTDKSLPARVAEQLMNLICTQELQEGDKLPNEFELAAQLQVGRGSVREAVKLLVARNVLEIRRGKGTFIARHTGETKDPLGFAFYSDQFQLAMDLLEVRMHLETWVVADAAMHATEEDCKKLLDKCQAVENNIRMGVNHLDSDKAFHRAIASCTHNVVMPKLIPVIVYSVDLFGALTKRALKEETILQHRAMTNAIIRHDPDAAREAMLLHLQQNRDALHRAKEKYDQNKEKENTLT